MLDRKEFVESLKKKVYLFDGGIGTELYNRGVFINRCFEELNLSDPDLVKRVHADYVDAGADIIETNTFGANRFKLKSHNLVPKLAEINRRGAEIAREIAGSNTLVAGSVGPFGARIEPLGPISRKEAREYFKEQLIPLIEGGVELFIFETFIYSEELVQAVRAARELCDLPTIAQITIDEDAASLTGASPEATVAELEDSGADVIGINCTVGPQVMLNWLERARKITKLPISVMPNAGKPKNIDGRNIYLASPEYFGEYAKHYIQSGANIIGGCCGAGPEHIKRMRKSVSALKPRIEIKKISVADLAQKEQIEAVPKQSKSRLAKRISDGRFVVSVELLSPRGISAEKELQKARELYYYGIDAINIPDGPRASSRMSALALALLIRAEVGIEPLLHYVCRDRNVIGMQSDLLGAYAMGIKNILAVTGDPPKLGSYPDATGVFDVDSIGLVNILNRLNNGMDIAGNPIGSPSGFFVGVGANPGALDRKKELERLDWKIDAGAEFIITQPVFDLKVFEEFEKKVRKYDVPIIAGIWPLTSLRNANFLNNEIPGCNVPYPLLKRLDKVRDSKEDGLRVGIEISREILDTIKDSIGGVQLAAPFGRIQSVFEVLDGFNFS